MALLKEYPLIELVHPLINYYRHFVTFFNTVLINAGYWPKKTILWKTKTQKFAFNLSKDKLPTDSLQQLLQQGG